jgi:type II secretory ATPase GspE/PulE/Tfp pilus assembly ATPase PilB-like protein
MDIPTFLISSSVECILAQRLVRRVCNDCKERIELPDQHKQLYKDHGIDISTATFFKGKGCDICGGSGYKGRAGIHELLIMNDDMRALLLKEIAAGPIRNLARKDGMRTMLEDGLIKATKGVTTTEEILAAAQ